MKRNASTIEPQHKIRKLFHIGDNMLEDLYFINRRRQEYTITSVTGTCTFSETLVDIYEQSDWNPDGEKVYFTTNPRDPNILRFKNISRQKKYDTNGIFFYISTGCILVISMMYMTF